MLKIPSFPGGFVDLPFYGDLSDFSAKVVSKKYFKKFFESRKEFIRLYSKTPKRLMLQSEASDSADSDNQILSALLSDEEHPFPQDAVDKITKGRTFNVEYTLRAKGAPDGQLAAPCLNILNNPEHIDDYSRIKETIEKSLRASRMSEPMIAILEAPMSGGEGISIWTSSKLQISDMRYVLMRLGEEGFATNLGQAVVELHHNPFPASWDWYRYLCLDENHLDVKYISDVQEALLSDPSPMGII